LLALAHPAQRLRFVVGDHPEVGAERFDLRIAALQLTELLAAVRSPGAAEEDQHQGAAVETPIEAVELAVEVAELERRCRSTDGELLGHRRGGERGREGEGDESS
jgi:hypothetical protein